jgi:hypothetical protein
MQSDHLVEQRGLSNTFDLYNRDQQQRYAQPREGLLQLRDRLVPEDAWLLLGELDLPSRNAGAC